MTRLLFIAHRIPYPPNKGDKIRSYHELLYLSQYFEIDLVCFIDSPLDKNYLAKLGAICKTVSVFERSPWFKLAKMISGFILRKPLSVALYTHGGMQRAIHKLLAEHAHEKIFIFSGQMAQYIPVSLLSRTVIDFCDVDSHKWDNYAERMPFYLAWFYKLESLRMLAFEKKVSKSALAAFLITPAELKLFQDLGGQGQLFSMGNGVDTSFFSPRPEPYEPGRILFTGAMDYFPNEEGVSWFAQEVFPSLRKTFPQARFIIAGSNPSHKVKALGRIEGVTVTGFVEDMRQEQAKAHVVVVPLRIARGMQNKVLEAMACGKAVVVSPKALGGIHAEAGRDLLIAEEAEAFRTCVEKLLGNPALVAEMGQAARAHITSNLSWQANLSGGLLPLFGTR